MAEKRKSSVVSVCSAAVWLWWLVSAVAIEGRVVPLLQSYEKSGFRSTFSAIYDTSKYGILQLSNGMAETPQMGWNSWNFFACNINETVIKETGPEDLKFGMNEE